MSVRDVVAKEVCCAGDCINADSPGPLPCFGLRHAANRADRILSALAAAGYAVVPVEPTPHMAREGMRALVRDNGVADIYRTMLAAARETKA
jgi:hypothetical protein